MKTKLLALSAACLLLSACGGVQIDDPDQPLVFQTDADGRPLIQYAQVARPLETIINSDGATTAIRVLPSTPSPSLNPSQVTDYWMGATSEAMRRCGYAKDAIALRSKALDAASFDTGSNKLKGDVMASCARAKRFADAIMAELAKSAG
jgi:hypothetical protein